MTILGLGLAAPAPADQDEQAPGVHIERARPSAEAEAALARLRAWRAIYLEQLAPARRSAGMLFMELERSSLATLGDRCLGLLKAIDAVDRGALFPSGDPSMDRVLFGVLERFRSGARHCLADQYLMSYRLLMEADAGLGWVDQRLALRLRPPVRLPGLDRSKSPPPD